MPRHGRSRSVSMLLGCAGALLVTHAHAQQSPPANTSGQPSKTKVVRRPIIDLKKQAEEPRPGQVLPGQPQPQPQPQPEPAPQPQPEAKPEAKPEANPEPVEEPAPPPVQPAAAPPEPTPPTPPAPQPVPEQHAPAPAPAPAPPPAPAPAPSPVPAQPPEPLDLPNTTEPSTARTPAARVSKPLKPAPIPVTAEVPPPPAPVERAPEPTPTPAPTPAPVEVPPVAEPVAIPEPEPMPEPVPEPAGETWEMPAQEPPAEPLATATVAGEPMPVVVGEPINAQIISLDGPTDVIQWQVDEGEWTPVAVNNRADGIIAVRTGLGASITLTLADQVSVKVSRLTRVRFEQRTPEKPGMPVELVVELSRGEVDIKPLPMLPGGPAPAVVRIITPDRSFTTRLATGVRFDAFTGTRLKLVAGER